MLAIQGAMSEGSKHLSRLKSRKRGIEEFMDESIRGELVSTLERLMGDADILLLRHDSVKRRIGEVSKRMRR